MKGGKDDFDDCADGHAGHPADRAGLNQNADGPRQRRTERQEKRTGGKDHDADDSRLCGRSGTADERGEEDDVMNKLETAEGGE